MKSTKRLLLSIAWGLFFMELNGYSQSLADIARQEKEKREQQKTGAKVYTNDDLTKYDRSGEKSSQSPSTDAGKMSTTSRMIPPSQSPESEERLWSKRFIDAKGKIEELKQQGKSLQASLDDFSMKLLMQSDVYDREHLYPELATQIKKQIEKNKLDLTDAEQALEDLRDALRKSGYPRSWEDSQAALKPLPETEKKGPPQTKNQKYWQEQLAAIDKKYDSLIAPLDTQRFEMIHRVPPKEGQSTAQTGVLGLGAPPMVNELNAKIKELNQKRDQEKKDLVDQAIQEGALPGWFR
jgi:hypothetical protein